MGYDWIKATFIPAVVAKVRDATNLTRHFQGGSPSSQGGTASKFKELGNNFFYELTKYMLLIIQRKSFDFSPLLTEEI